MSARLLLRNLGEYVVLFGVWYCLSTFILRGQVPALAGTLIVLITAWAKTGFFGVENLWQLQNATRFDVAYHQFMFVMLVNMTQIIASFAFDFHCLYLLDRAHFGSIPADLEDGAILFEFFYFSVLNFTFFGYGDVTPQTVAAKLLTMTEIVLAFVTVIFLLSDFISLKESLRTGKAKPPA